MVFAENGEAFGRALNLEAIAGAEKVVSRNPGQGMTMLAELAAVDTSAVVGTAATVGPDTVAKYLMTSGSPCNPKPVITTRRMLTTNQAQAVEGLPFLRTRPPVVVDWLPWNHSFGGSYNSNMSLANGRAFCVDAGKPLKHMVGKAIENLGLKTGTLAFNVPVGFAFLRDAMREDADLRRRYIEDLDMLFSAGASLLQDVWTDLEAMACEVRGDVPLFNSSWGMTETSPGCLLGHEPAEMPGIIGVPMDGVDVKLIPDDVKRCELRLRGAHITPGYLHDPEKTAGLCGVEGFLVSGDAVKVVDPDRPAKGMRFDGRMSEDFKLNTRTWVRSANLRLELLPKLAPYAQDIVICGADRGEIGILVFPAPSALDLAGVGATQDGALVSDALTNAIRTALPVGSHQHSSTRIARLLGLVDESAMSEGEITAKGNLNFRKTLARRAALYARLFGDDDPVAIRP